jgi:hypothetical protein
MSYAEFRGIIHGDKHKKRMAYCVLRIPITLDALRTTHYVWHLLLAVSLIVALPPRPKTRRA